MRAEPSTVDRLRAAGCVFAEEEAALLEAEAATSADLERMLRDRVGGRPLEQVLGWAEFCGLRIVVEPGVFVPRRRTELLAELAISFAEPGSVVVDLCCGTGAIATAVASALGTGDAEVYASDVDEAAVRCARRNLSPEAVFAGDLFDALPGGLRGRIDVLVVNAPYVPTDDVRLMPPEARDHEARIALDGGDNGLAVQRRVAAEARSWLASNGRVLIETSRAQLPATAQLLIDAGFGARAEYDDTRGSTVVVGTAQPAPSRPEASRP